LRAKNEAVFKDITWKNNMLSFSIQSSLKHTNDITCLVPAIYGKKKVVHITSNGVEQSFSTRMIKGCRYALIAVSPGSSYNITVSYTD
jgi:hypothetical protein